MAANCFGIPDTIDGLAVKQGPDDMFYVERPDGTGERLVEAERWDALLDEIDATPTPTDWFSPIYVILLCMMFCLSAFGHDMVAF